MFRWGPEDVVRVITGEYDIEPHRYKEHEWDELLSVMADIVVSYAVDISEELCRRAMAVAKRPVEPFPHDHVNACWALLQELDMGEGDEYVASLLGLANVIEREGQRIADALEQRIREFRRESGRCPECGGKLRDGRWVEGFRLQEGRVCSVCEAIYLSL